MNELQEGIPKEDVNRYDIVHQEIGNAIEKHKNAYNGWREQRFQELKDLAYEADRVADRRKGRRQKKQAG